MTSKNSVQHLPFSSKHFDSLRDDKVPPVEKEQLPLEEDAFLLHNFLSPEQCRWIIDATEDLGYQEQVYWETRPPYRRNTRVRITSAPPSDQDQDQDQEAEKEERDVEGFMGWLWRHIRPHVPDTVTLQDLDIYTRMDLEGGGGYPTGTWHPTAVNDIVRCCKYDPGGVFSAHFDGNHVRDDGERSFYTFMIYLNGGFQAGNTNFLVRRQYHDDAAADLPDSATGPEYGIRYRLRPYAGLAIVFRHTLLHEGEPLGSDVKYLLRSDVIYSLEEEDALHRSMMVTRKAPIEQKRQEARRLWKLAEDLERSGQVEKAARMHTRAETLDPEINLLS
eukprot:gb/GECH01000775.1/.p1 GENE.gb/GECH01000775.1/~~gb/GECH01000775.1/.p1  ORF type:complete len:333 (+),score=67.43 gb/GECH01000775.1/:1-999(+)